jgi:hypothetical protein
MDVCATVANAEKAIERSIGAFEQQLAPKAAAETTPRKAPNSLTTEAIMHRLRRHFHSRKWFGIERVTIRTEIGMKTTLPAPHAQCSSGDARCRVPPLGYSSYRDLCEVRIRGTHIGMLPRIAENNFSPFFTTQECGSALGLTIAHNIVQAHQGTIHVVSTEGQRLDLDPHSASRIDAIATPGSGNTCIDPWWRDPPGIRCSPDVMEK